MKAHLTALAALAVALPGAALAEVSQGPKNVPEFEPAFPEQTRAPEATTGARPVAEEIAGGLEHPWGIAVLPEGGYLVTERPGRLRVVSAEGEVSEPLEGVPEVAASKQGGLLDVALSPDFASDRVIYLTYAKPVGGQTATAAAKAVLSQDMTALTDVVDVFVQDPPSPSPMHYGSRVTPVGDMLWITTGEHFTAGERVFAQDLGKTYGKVIRVMNDGTVPDDNPFLSNPEAKPEIWSYGHRNIQGDAIGPDGRYWTIEHGPKGGDELNLPMGGANYGWPEVSYGETYQETPVGTGASSGPDFEEPVYYWDPVIAPGDMVFYQGAAFPEWEGDLLIGSLTPGGIVRLELDGDRVSGEERLFSDFGRVRDIEVDSDGTLLVLTDQADGALIRVMPEGAAATD